MPRHSRAQARTTLARMKVVFGIPSVLVISGVYFSESLVDLILSALPSWQAHLIWLAVLALVALIAFDRWNREVTGTLAASELGQSGDSKLADRRGLVIILGLDSQRTDSPVAKLLAACPNVEYLALIGTPETQMRRVAPDIVSHLAPSLGRAVAASHVRVFEQGNNAQSVADFEQDTSDAIRWMMRQGLAAHEIVVDTSNGRRAMGYGALIAAEHAHVEVQYLALAWNHMDNTPIPGAEMFKVVRELHPV